jgi:hypothetical protein
METERRLVPGVAPPYPSGSRIARKLNELAGLYNFFMASL